MKSISLTNFKELFKKSQILYKCSAFTLYQKDNFCIKSFNASKYFYRDLHIRLTFDHPQIQKPIYRSSSKYLVFEYSSEIINMSLQEIVSDLFSLIAHLNINGYVINKLRPELCRCINHKIVVIDFSYATQAWKYNGENYILRPCYDLFYRDPEIREYSDLKVEMYALIGCIYCFARNSYFTLEEYSERYLYENLTPNYYFTDLDVEDYNLKELFNECSYFLDNRLNSWEMLSNPYILQHRVSCYKLEPSRNIYLVEYETQLKEMKKFVDKASKEGLKPIILLGTLFIFSHIFNLIRNLNFDKCFRVCSYLFCLFNKIDNAVIEIPLEEEEVIYYLESCKHQIPHHFPDKLCLSYDHFVDFCIYYMSKDFIPGWIVSVPNQISSFKKIGDVSKILDYDYEKPLDLVQKVDNIPVVLNEVELIQDLPSIKFEDQIPFIIRNLRQFGLLDAKTKKLIARRISKLGILKDKIKSYLF